MILRKCLLDDSPKGSYPEEKNGKKGDMKILGTQIWPLVPNGTKSQICDFIESTSDSMSLLH